MMKDANYYQSQLDNCFERAQKIVNSGKKTEFLSSEMSDKQLMLVTDIINKIEKQK